jgi:hypothetical protein
MLDVDTFLTTLYVTVDDSCQSGAPKSKPGSQASLCASEVITLSIFARWSRFASERDFYRYATINLRDAFPTLPDRSQFNRLVRSCAQLIEAFALHLASLLTDAQKCPYQALEIARLCLSGIASVGGMAGWPEMPTSVGLTAWDGRRALACSPRSIPRGSLPASVSQRSLHTADQQLAETFFAVRAQPNQRLISVGSASSRPYIADSGQGLRGRREPSAVA